MSSLSGQQTVSVSSTNKVSSDSVSDFQIVPLKGLPIVAVILIGLVLAIATNKLWALDFFHVVGGALWTATDLFIGLFIGPMVLARLSVQSRIEFSKRFMPKMLLIIPTLITMTLAGGFQLARHLGYLAPTQPEHNWLILAFCVVGIMLLVAMGSLAPANLAILFELKKPAPNPMIISSLMRRFIYGSAILGIMQVATLLIMTKVATL